MTRSSDEQLPPLADEARETLLRAHLIAAGRDSRVADGLDLLSAFVAGGRARALLDLFDVDVARVARSVELLHQARMARSATGFAGRVVDDSRREAARLRHSRTGSEHLVLGLLRSGNTPAAGVLASALMTLDAGREAVRFMHDEVDDWDPPLTRAGSVTTAGTKDTGVLAPERSLAIGAPRGLGGLKRIVAVAQVKTVGGTTLELLAFEIRTEAAVLHWRASWRMPRLLNTLKTAVTDDLGTKYEVGIGGWNGDDHGGLGETIVIPPPRLEARTLSVDVEALGADVPWWPVSVRRDGLPDFRSNSMMDDLDGPWHFEFSLT